MAGACAMPVDAGLIRGLLGSVDCNVQTMSAAAYSALMFQLSETIAAAVTAAGGAARVDTTP